MKTITYYQLVSMIAEITNPTQPDSDHGAETFFMAHVDEEGKFIPPIQTVQIFEIVSTSSRVLRVEVAVEEGRAHIDFVGVNSSSGSKRASCYNISPIFGGEWKEEVSTPPFRRVCTIGCAMIFFEPFITALLQFAGVQSIEELAEG